MFIIRNKILKITDGYVYYGILAREMLLYGWNVSESCSKVWAILSIPIIIFNMFGIIQSDKKWQKCIWEIIWNLLILHYWMSLVFGNIAKKWIIISAIVIIYVLWKKLKK